MTMTIYFGRQFGTTEPRGRIGVEPHVWLRAKGTVGNLRKMLKLSAESDQFFGTLTLPLWEEAVCDNYREDKDIEPCELHNAELEHKSRLRAADAWFESHLQKEDERFRKAKVHRGKSHAERVQEIEERYSRMVAEGKRRYAREIEAIRKRAVRRRQLAEEQLAEVRKFVQEVRTA